MAFQCLNFFDNPTMNSLKTGPHLKGISLPNGSYPQITERALAYSVKRELYDIQGYQCILQDKGTLPRILNFKLSVKVSSYCTAPGGSRHIALRPHMELSEIHFIENVENTRATPWVFVQDQLPLPAHLPWLN